MRRALLPILLLLSLACDKENKPQAKGGGKTVPPAVLPTTGNPRIREMREDLVEEVERAEKDLDSGTKPAPYLVSNWKKGVDHLITAARLAIQSEADEAVRRGLAALQEKQAVLDKSRNDLAEEILEIQGYLDGIQNGAGKPPEGFTEDELKDRLGERQEQARALEKEEDGIRARMKEKEDLLAQGKPPPQGATLHTHELEALVELKARIEKLDARLK